MICDRVIESHVKREFTKISNIGSIVFNLCFIFVYLPTDSLSSISHSTRHRVHDICDLLQPPALTELISPLLELGHPANRGSLHLILYNIAHMLGPWLVRCNRCITAPCAVGAQDG